MSAPLATPTATAVWRMLGAGQTGPDEDNGWVYAHLVNAATTDLAVIEAIVRASDGRPGWAIALDPDTIPADGLPWLAPFAGVRLDDNLSTAGQRQQIKDRPYHKRGTVGAILAAARPWLTSGDVVLVERDGGAYQLTVQYTAAQVGAISTYAEIEAAYTTYAQAEAALKYYADTNGGEPQLQSAVLTAKPVGLVATFDKIV